MRDNSLHQEAGKCGYTLLIYNNVLFFSHTFYIFAQTFVLTQNYSGGRNNLIGLVKFQSVKQKNKNKI